MTDRELLELAAWAAGIKAGWVDTPYEQCFKVPYQSADGLMGGWKVWNPLEDDGDALRLAVKLRFVVAVRGHEIEIFSDDDGDCLESIPIPPDGSRCPLEMTRRAIVEAAAEIGKTRSD